MALAIFEKMLSKGTLSPSFLGKALLEETPSVSVPDNPREPSTSLPFSYNGITEVS